MMEKERIFSGSGNQFTIQTCRDLLWQHRHSSDYWTVASSASARNKFVFFMDVPRLTIERFAPTTETIAGPREGCVQLKKKQCNPTFLPYTK